MNHLITFKSNLKKLNIFAKKLAKISKTPDIILLQGELGTGKTTFARYFINALFYKMNIPLPFSTIALAIVHNCSLFIIPSICIIVQSLSTWIETNLFGD